MIYNIKYDVLLINSAQYEVDITWLLARKLYIVLGLLLSPTWSDHHEVMMFYIPPHFLGDMRE